MRVKVFLPPPGDACITSFVIPVPQLTIMAAIVTTLCFPAAAALVLLSCALLGVPIHSVVTFGETFNALAGVSVWWVIGFLPAFAYAALASH